MANDQLREAHRDIAFLQAAHLLSQSHGHRPRWSAGRGTRVPFATAFFSDERKQLRGKREQGVRVGIALSQGQSTVRAHTTTFGVHTYLVCRCQPHCCPSHTSHSTAIWDRTVGRRSHRGAGQLQLGLEQQQHGAKGQQQAWQHVGTHSHCSSQVVHHRVRCACCMRAPGVLWGLHNPPRRAATAAAGRRRPAELIAHTLRAVHQQQRLRQWLSIHQQEQQRGKLGHTHCKGIPT